MCIDLTVSLSLSLSDLASAVHLHSSTEEEDHILQTASLTGPHQSLWQLIYMLVEKSQLYNQHTIWFAWNSAGTVDEVEEYAKQTCNSNLDFGDN